MLLFRDSCCCLYFPHPNFCCRFPLSHYYSAVVFFKSPVAVFFHLKFWLSLFFVRILAVVFLKPTAAIPPPASSACPAGPFQRALHRTILMFVFHACVSVLCTRKIKDTQCGETPIPILIRCCRCNLGCKSVVLLAVSAWLGFVLTGWQRPIGHCAFLTSH